jgi:hypothetical protein
MRKIIVSLLFIISCFSLYSQYQSDSIQIKRRFGTVYQLDGKTIGPYRILQVVKTDPAAYRQMKTAIIYYDMSSAFAGISGCFMGDFAASITFEHDPNWTMAAISAGMLLVAIPLSIGYDSHARSAVGLYNSSLRYYPGKKTEMKFACTSNGLTVRLIF